MTEDEHAKCGESATAAYEHLGKALQNSIKKLVDEATGEMADYVATWMESDANSNFYSMVTNRTNRIIKGLLSGGYDEKTAKEWLAGYDFEQYRKNIYMQYKDIIHSKLIEELQAENADLKRSLEMYRRREY
jgi:hypothetical protein